MNYAKKTLLIPLLLGIFQNFTKQFPADFKWGTALSAYQNCGAKQLPDSNWAFWEKDKGHIKDGQSSGYSCCHWDLYPKDIALIKELGLNAVRVSIDWSCIEPEPGKFNQAALEYYRRYCMAFVEAGISVMVTLHHFVHPQWFEELGAFEKEKNIKYFVRFCKKVYETVGDIVDFWCTINEPTVLVLQGYFRGVFPPGKMNPVLGFKVLRNLMKAHTDVYLALKKMAGKKDIVIGFSHAYLKFEHHNPLNILERTPGYLFNYILNDTVLEFCATGNFKISPWAPELISAFLPKGIEYITPSFFNYTTPTGKKTLDFFGINYYSRVVARHIPSLTNPFNVLPLCHDGEIMTDMPYAMYGQGLYHAIVDIAKIGVPIYITENGLADAADTRRKQFLKEYLAALQQAIDENYNIKGYYYWSLLDNFEWDLGYGMKFGLYEVNFETQERILRNGSKYYKKFVKQAIHCVTK
jgi:beta-glucosidase